jgi:hypothetical protein
MGYDFKGRWILLMSLMIKGIDLPGKNQTIFVEVFPNGKCAVMKTEKGECYELTTKGEAKAIQIPKDHGRLIDGDELMKRMKRDNPQTSKTKWMQILVKNAPTILEAEE